MLDLAIGAESAGWDRVGEGRKGRSDVCMYGTGLLGMHIASLCWNACDIISLLPLKAADMSIYLA